MVHDVSGTLTGETLWSRANRRRFEHWLWVPDGPGPFNLLFLLHGVYDAGGFVWWTQGRAHETAARLVTDGDMAPTVVVMPTDTGAELGSGYCDWADGTTRAESYLIRELLPHLEETLPLSGKRWITGLSMGGYGALLLALRHPGIFESATATSGFFYPDRLFKFVDDAADRMWGTSEVKQSHDVRSLIADAERVAGLRIALDCGTDDDLIEENRDFHRHLDELGIAHGYAEHGGGHEWSYWADHLEDHLRFHAVTGGPLV